jgi:rod shape determining protein RodA
MNRNRHLKLDWVSLLLMGVLLLIGWLNIYAASSKSLSAEIFDLDLESGRQMIWIAVAILTGLVVLSLDTKFIEFTSLGIYGLCMLLLVLVLLFGHEVNGSKSWFELGFFRLQPSEFAKVGTAMALARVMSTVNFSLRNTADQLKVLAVIGLPIGLILLQKDTGTALVFCSFFFVLFREGMSYVYVVFLLLAGIFAVLAIVANKVLVIIAILSLGFLSYYFVFRYRHLRLHIAIATALVGLTLSIDFIVNQVLLPHQRVRILALFDPKVDPLGANWNTTQSKIAIGSGGLTGKGFLNGTQTKYDFVPQQSTDFIFCTVGEEHGWFGSVLVLALFFLFLYQLIQMAELAKSDYSRVFGYAVASIFFFHIVVNISMTIGLAPVIGIPLPFFSYGGSSLLAFTTMVFMLQNLFANRIHILTHSR